MFQAERMVFLSVFMGNSHEHIMIPAGDVNEMTVNEGVLRGSCDFVVMQILIHNAIQITG